MFLRLWLGYNQTLKDKDLENPRLHSTSDGFKIGTVAVEITYSETSIHNF